MKKLILVRHGKSSWNEPLPDKERPLKKRGYRDAEIITSAFSHHFEKPVKAYSSPAVRANTTAQIFKEKLGIEDRDFEVSEALYTFDESELVDFIKSRDDTIDQLMLFGHNPGFTNLANELGDQYLENLPTTGLVVIVFETNSWKSIKKGTSLLTLFAKNFK